MAKILIVDDKEQNCELVADIISSWGYEVHKVFQGLEAIDFAIQQQPEIILLDVMLPGMNGFEVCKELKRNPQTDNIYVIMLTVLSDAEDRIRGFEVGADSFMTKPANYHELRHIIASRLKRKQMLDREMQRRVCASFMELMKAQNPQLYLEAWERRQLCDRIGRLLLPEEQLNRLLAAAQLCDIGSLAVGGEEAVEAGVAIVSHLKLGDWLALCIRSHHMPLSSPGFPQNVAAEFLPGLRILTTVTRYLELYKASGSKDGGLLLLLEEARSGDWDAETVAALQQLRSDETFIQKLNSANN